MSDSDSNEYRDSMENNQKPTTNSDQEDKQNAPKQKVNKPIEEVLTETEDEIEESDNLYFSENSSESQEQTEEQDRKRLRLEATSRTRSATPNTDENEPKSSEEEDTTFDFSKLRFLIEEKVLKSEGEESSSEKKRLEVVRFYCFFEMCAREAPFDTEQKLEKHLRNDHGIRNQSALEKAARLKTPKSDSVSSPSETPASPHTYTNTKFIYSDPNTTDPGKNKKICNIGFCKGSNPRSSFQTQLDYECHVGICHGDEDPGSETTDLTRTCKVGFCQNSNPKSSFKSQWNLALHDWFCHGRYYREKEAKTNEEAALNQEMNQVEPDGHFCTDCGESFEDEAAFACHVIKYCNQKRPEMEQSTDF